MERQKHLQDKFKLSDWERFDFDQEECTLTLSSGGKPRVVASMQIVGSHSARSATWR